MIEITKACLQDIEPIVRLFDKYRVFYGKESNINDARLFLLERFSNEESIIFLARKNKDAIGFTQLYQAFSSVSMQPLYILNDLYVDDSHRNEGVGTLLLKRAQSFCKEENYKGLVLETAKNNPAQKLYEKLGWKKDEDFLHYHWSATDSA